MGSYVNLAYDYPVLGVFWTVLGVFLWIMWIFLLFRVIVDLFRDDSLSGWAKTGWLVFTIVLPFLGVFVYVIARGKGMGRREQKHAQAKMEERTGTSGRPSAPPALPVRRTNSPSSEVRARGDISDEEFRQAKEKVLHH
ncbi:SHOCT domain-containing protein [Streptomyces phaeochromogenes]|uniref:SHOCT domain-containing protein n=1 Tax=Streptomyces phaeochromogenes TaxID=1923 RepID=UPI0033DD05EC